MFPWIVVLAVLGLVMIFAEILMPGLVCLAFWVQSPFLVRFALTFKIYGFDSIFNHAGCSCGCIFCNGISGKVKVDCTIRLFKG